MSIGGYAPEGGRRIGQPNFPFKFKNLARHGSSLPPENRLSGNCTQPPRNSGTNVRVTKQELAKRNPSLENERTRDQVLVDARDQCRIAATGTLG